LLLHTQINQSILPKDTLSIEVGCQKATVPFQSRPSWIKNNTWKTTVKDRMLKCSIAISQNKIGWTKCEELQRGVEMTALTKE
jgi:hypothetical protein